LGVALAFEHLKQRMHAGPSQLSGRGFVRRQRVLDEEREHSKTPPRKAIAQKPA
jgi:hypothetical protein